MKKGIRHQLKLMMTKIYSNMDYHFQSHNLNYDYKAELKKAMQFNILFSAVLFILIFFLANIQSAVLVSLLLFISLYLKSLSRNKYFISQLEINKNTLSIIYKEKGIERQLNGTCNDFKFKKKMAVSRSRIPYLRIYFNGESAIEQFVNLDWTEKDFNEAIKALNAALST